VGIADTTAHLPVVRRAFTALRLDDFKLHSQDEVFNTFLKVHPKPKESFFLYLLYLKMLG
jgi:ATP-dependent HslUV protease, peptidase subunit HslV